MREEIFSKFKDYNRELEKILEKKDFLADTKNLLLSMFYKLEISYNDYSTVKRKSRSKQEYLENILENIKNIHHIELVKPIDDEFEEFKRNGQYTIDFKKGTIKVIANELALLSSILEFNNFQIHLNEKYNLIRNAIPYLLNTAYDMENTEVLRDFNAWSWNTLTTEIKDMYINATYQMLKIACNADLFQLIQNTNAEMDMMDIIKQELLRYYPEKTIEKLIEMVSKIAIMIYITISENEKKRLKEEKERIEQELAAIKDKKKYIENQIENRKKITRELKQIDLTLNNRELLYQEYEKRNQKLPSYQQFFSLSHLTEKMQRERRKLLEKIEQCNHNMEPQTYLYTKNQLQQDYHLLNNISFEKQNSIEKEMKRLQSLFVNEILVTRIEKIETEEELLNMVYELRYYCFLPIQEGKTLGNDEKLEMIKEKLIQKLFIKKRINTLSTNEQNDIAIVKQIFHLRMIYLEDIYIQIKKGKEQCTIQIYDEKDTLEMQYQMPLTFEKKDKIKWNKKIKLFI